MNIIDNANGMKATPPKTIPAIAIPLPSDLSPKIPNTSAKIGGIIPIKGTQQAVKSPMIPSTKLATQYPFVPLFLGLFE